MAERGVQAGARAVQLRGTRAKGEGTGPPCLDLQGWPDGGGGEGLWTSAFLFLERVPAPCPRQGHSDSFLFQPGKPPPCPHSHPGLWDLEEETWSPQGQASHPRFLQLFPAWPEPGAPQPGLPQTRVLGRGKKVWQPHSPPRGQAQPGTCPPWACAGALCGQTLLGPLDGTPLWESGFQDKGVLEAAGVGWGGVEWPN